MSENNILHTDKNNAPIHNTHTLSTHDYIVRATAADSSIRAFAITSRETVETARQAHETWPVMTAALGRLLSGAAMMGVMMKGDNDLLTLQIQCDGPAQGLTVTADSKGNVKGFASNPQVDLPLNALGKLDVGGALGTGVLSVIKDLGLKDPYVGQCELVTGEIAEDLTYYFASSEQVPSAVGLGVLVDKDGSVREAGGFIIQLLPFAEDAVIAQLEQKISEISSVTEMLSAGLSPEGILQEILGSLGLEITDSVPARFHCDCSRERVSRALATLSSAELNEIIEAGEDIEVKCHFCNTAYSFSPEDLKGLIAV